jgi:hypothetical protein
MSANDPNSCLYTLQSNFHCEFLTGYNFNGSHRSLNFADAGNKTALSEGPELKMKDFNGSSCGGDPLIIHAISSYLWL